MDIWVEIDRNELDLEQSLKTLRHNGIENAEAERKYRVLKAKKILELKDKGYPATLIIDIVKGMEDVAKLKFERDVAESVYKANLEAINVYKKKSDDLRMYFEKEYSNVR